MNVPKTICRLNNTWKLTDCRVKWFFKDNVPACLKEGINHNIRVIKTFINV
jgi:hypothetical protein